MTEQSKDYLYDARLSTENLTDRFKEWSGEGAMHFSAIRTLKGDLVERRSRELALLATGLLYPNFAFAHDTRGLMVLMYGTAGLTFVAGIIGLIFRKRLRTGWWILGVVAIPFYMYGLLLVEVNTPLWIPYYDFHPKIDYIQGAIFIAAAVLYPVACWLLFRRPRRPPY